MTNLRSLLSFVMSSLDLKSAWEFCLSSFNMHTLNEVTSWTVHLILSIIISATEWFHARYFKKLYLSWLLWKAEKKCCFIWLLRQNATPVNAVNTSSFVVGLSFQTCSNPIPSLRRRLGFHSRSSKPYSCKKDNTPPRPQLSSHLLLSGKDQYNQCHLCFLSDEKITSPPAFK